MGLNLRETLAGALSGQLRQAVRRALGEPGALLRRYEAAPLRGASGVRPAGGWLFSLEGTARVGAAERPWAVALKVLAPRADQSDPTHARYWKREALLYGSGVLDDLTGGLRAPRSFGCD